MKPLSFFLLLTALLIAFLVLTSKAQTIRRCNNNLGVTGVNIYSTIQAAHDAAANGDIIYVEQSSVGYGSLNCTKRLTIIGNGYLRGENAISDNRESVIGQANLNAGSANSLITGVRINSGNDPATLNITNASSVTVTRCKIDNEIAISGSSSLSAITISQCMIAAAITGNSAINCTIKNNIIRFNVYGFTNSSVMNNTFYYEDTPKNLTNCIITNNIFKYYPISGNSQQTPFFNGSNTGNTISNNVLANSGSPGALGASILPTGNGNINDVNYSTLFISTDPTNPVVDKNFQLKSGSSAIGVGTGGTNAGAFGGLTPYVLAGLPAYPVITNFSTSGAGNVTTPLQISVTVRSNN